MSATTSKEFIAARAYDYEGIALNVYAIEGEEGWELSSVKLVGSDVDLVPMLSSSQIDYFDALVERRELADAREERYQRQIDAAAYLILSH